MWNWLALLGTPTLSLTVLSVAFALVTPSCARQSMAWLHVLHAAGVGLGLCFTAAAWLQRGHASSTNAANRQRFVHRMAAPLGFLFTMVMLAQWVATWILSPCFT